MSMFLTAFLAVLTYLIVALGVMRFEMPRRFEALRTPCNGEQMPVSDARREAVRLAAQDGFTWPLLLAAFAMLAPLVIVFDGIPAAARVTGRGVAAGARAVAPALGPVTGWASKPLALAVQRDEAKALTARADEPAKVDEPLVPDEIARWVPPVERHGPTITFPFPPEDYDDVVIEHIRAARAARATRARGYGR